MKLLHSTTSLVLSKITSGVNSPKEQGSKIMLVLTKVASAIKMLI